jgi:PAS domain S-box-containing protein
VNFRIINSNGDIQYLTGSAAPIFIEGELVKIIGVNQDITKSKASEIKLKESEARNRLFTQNVPDFLLQIDKTGKINYINRTLEVLTQKDVIGSSIYSWIPEEFSEQFKDKIEKVFSDGGNEIMEHPGNELKGEPLWFESKIGPLETSGIITQAIIVSRDISERKTSKDKLIKSEKNFKHLFNSMTEMFQVIELIYDKDGEVCDYSFIQVNHAFEKLVNLKGSELVGKSAKEIFGVIEEHWLKLYESVDKTGKPREYENYGAEFDKYYGINAWKIKEKQIAILFTDISERKTAELDLKKALEEIIGLKQQLEAENIYLKEELKLEGSFNEIIGSSKTLRKVLRQVEQVAKTDSTVLILGETGTGKELIARAIHHASDRKDKAMVKVNCSALPENLIESELFGHEKGAFTGAINRKIGRFELANGGTIFLDEIGDLPIELQTRLLRVLQESEFERVGGEKTIKVDVRVITATNRNLAQQVLENKFRQDLYYRLNVFPITCPPLRKRVDDIPSLVHHFVNKYNSKVNNKIKTVHPKTIERLMHYNWPGNIRELEHVIERALITNQGDKLRLGSWFVHNSTDKIVPDELTTLEVMDRDYIVKVLEKTKWKIRGKNGASEILGLKPTTLESRMKKLNINRIR